LTRSINERATSIIASIKKKAELFRSHEETLRNQVRQKEEKVMDLSKQRIEYDTLSRDLQSKRDLLNKVLDKRQETEIASKSKSNNMREVYPAEDPLKPIKPRFILTLFLGLFGGFGIAVGLAFFVNYLDDSIKSQDDVETYLRLPFLGYVPNIKTNSLVERDLQAHVHPRSNAAEGFRTIRAAIPYAQSRSSASPSPARSSEGKSLLASNLAIVSAQTGLKTLLVDADLRRPSVHKAFQLHCPAGRFRLSHRRNQQLRRMHSEH
jgi:hypothetical protein